MSHHPAILQRQVERIHARERGAVPLGPKFGAESDASPEFDRSPSLDTLVVEAPLELRIDGESFAVIMRTPGHDEELARGLLFAEGVLSTDATATIERPTDLPHESEGNVLDISIPGPVRLPARNLLSTASCGVCGRVVIADLEERLAICRSGLQVGPGLIAALPGALRAAQAVFDATGGLHAAAAFDPTGQLLALREDVGRHNAVDKLVGWALTAGLVPCDAVILCVSGRIGFEIVQKAIAAGFPILVAVSAPSSLAVDLAERFRVTLCGFTRGKRFNLYSHGSRIVSHRSRIVAD